MLGVTNVPLSLFSPAIQLAILPYIKGVGVGGGLL